MFKDNPDFYPTPKKLISKMLSKVNFHKKNFNNILEPSAGRGDIIEVIREKEKSFYSKASEVFAIEKDPDLQKILIGKKFNLIDSDFLTYNGMQHFDLIIANFPFSEGDKHLMKAIDIMFNGHIVCLLNAETLKNPCTNLRKDLVARLKKLNADIEYLEGEFVQADRKTNVEVALIHIVIENTVENELYRGLKEDTHEDVEELRGGELATNDDIFNMVKNYELDKKHTIEQIIKFYENYHRVSSYMSLAIDGEGGESSDNLTVLMQSKINKVLTNIKRKYWREAMQLKEVKSKLTSNKRAEINEYISCYEKMEFSVSNIKIFITNLGSMFPKLIEESIEKIFDELTSYGLQDSRWGNEFKTNVHYYNGWKTNNAYKVNKKVILPRICEVGFRNEINMVYRSQSILDDLELVARYFSMQKHGSELAYDVCKNSVANKEYTKIDTGMFLITLYKKGTAHIEWKDEDALRWFNIEAGKIKKFLPMDYAEKDYTEMNNEEKTVVTGFEGKDKYKTTRKLNVLGSNPLLIGLDE